MGFIKIIISIGTEFCIHAAQVAPFVDIVHEGRCEFSILGVGDERVDSKVQ